MPYKFISIFMHHLHPDLIFRCIIKLLREKSMLAGPKNIRTKDSIVYLSNISPIINVILNRIFILQQSNAQN